MVLNSSSLNAVSSIGTVQKVILVINIMTAILLLYTILALGMPFCEGRKIVYTDPETGERAGK